MTKNAKRQSNEVVSEDIEIIVPVVERARIAIMEWFEAEKEPLSFAMTKHLLDTLFQVYPTLYERQRLLVSGAVHLMCLKLWADEEEKNPAFLESVSRTLD